MNRLGIATVASLLALSTALGCDVGSVDNGPGTGMVGNPDDPLGEVDELIVCEGQLSISGTFTPAAEIPPDAGCVPSGTWAFTVSISDQGECDAIPVEASYTYEITGDVDSGWTYSYADDPENELVYLTHQGAGGNCKGNFEHWSMDGTELMLLQPFVNDDLTIIGNGYFEKYTSDQSP